MFIKRVLSLSELLGGPAKRRKEANGDLFATTYATSPTRHEFYWPQADLSGLPSVVVPSKGDVEGFFADVATFYSSMSPMSAYVHVLGNDLKGKIASLEQPEVGYNAALSRDQQNIWLALAIAESASSALLSGSVSERDVTYSLCRRSLSFTLARATMLYPGYSRQKIATKWLQLRELSKMEFPPELAASVLWIAKIAFDEPETSGPQKDITELHEVVRGLVTRSYPDSKLVGFLLSHYPEISNHFGVLSGSYDGRMQGLTGIIEVVRRQSRGPELDGLTIAFFCNAILPGSLNYLRLLSRYQAQYPSILLWYGFFSALAEGFDWSGVLGGLGQKLARDLRAPFSLENPPTADVALEELLVLARVGLTPSSIKPVQQRTVLVSLLPGVEIFARMPVEGDVARRQASSAMWDEEQERRALRDQRLMRILAEAQDLLRADVAPGAGAENKPPKASRRKIRQV